MFGENRMGDSSCWSRIWGMERRRVATDASRRTESGSVGREHGLVGVKLLQSSKDGSWDTSSLRSTLRSSLDWGRIGASRRAPKPKVGVGLAASGVGSKLSSSEASSDGF
uniref:(northern house mosquito) hypothetical protein n=1 Tax=Culex pipiens TaxID=7175 RepID=A0A8D8JH65_CULPI